MLLWVHVMLLLRVVLLLWVMLLLLLGLAVIHHATRGHLVVTHLGTIQLSIHGSTHHSLPLPHGSLHVGLGATIVHHLAIGQCPHALLVGMLLVTCLQAAIHAHPVTVETGTR